MNDTGIAWCSVSWNPCSGCEEVSEGCKHCYARTIAETKGGKAFPNGFGLTIRPHKLKEPYRLKNPSLVFVNSMSDLFWEAIPETYRDQIVDVIEDCPQHEFQVLTKRHENMLRYSRRRKLPPNFWAGVSLENQRNLARVDALAQVDAEVRFISVEPLLGPINFHPGQLEAMHWVITGGESGNHFAKPFNSSPAKMVDWLRVVNARGLVMLNEKTRRWEVREERADWVRSIRDQCIAAGTSFFHKQWGGPTSESGGRQLDGRTWDEFPRHPRGDKWLNPKLIKAGVKADASKVRLNVVGQKELF